MDKEAIITTPIPSTPNSSGMTSPQKSPFKTTQPSRPQIPKSRGAGIVSYDVTAEEEPRIRHPPQETKPQQQQTTPTKANKLAIPDSVESIESVGSDKEGDFEDKVVRTPIFKKITDDIKTNHYQKHKLTFDEFAKNPAKRPNKEKHVPEEEDSGSYDEKFVADLKGGI